MVEVVLRPVVHIDDAVLEYIGHPVDELRDDVTELA
jgi:hypothetical protein